MVRKRIYSIAVITLLLFSISNSLFTNVVAAKYADGKYEANYEVLRADNDSASIADGYFVKPATLIVEDGKIFVQLTVKSSDMVKSLTGPNGKASVVSENKSANTKVFKFQVNDVSQPVNMSMHIVVNAGDIQYDTEHKARFVFSTNSLKDNTTATGSTNKPEQGNKGGEKVENPKTSDETPILLFAVLLIGSGLVIARRFVLNKNS